MFNATKSALVGATAPLAIAAALAAPSTGPATASFGDEATGEDILCLKDGRIIDGFEMEQKDGFVTVHLNAGTVDIKDSLVDVLLEKDKEISFVPQTEDEKEKFEAGYVRLDGRWTKIRTATKAIEKSVKARVKQAEEDRSHEMWKDRYITETPHFVWHHNTPMPTTERFIGACDAYFEIFKKDWKIKRNKKKPKLSINFYVDRKTFQRGADAGPGVLAYFRFVGDYDLCAFYDRLDPDFTEQVLFHELGHYLHKLIDESFKYPHWPGESLSEFYGGASYDASKDKLEVGLIQNGRLATIKREMADGKKINLRKMITTAGFEDYTWGWSFVHMLMNSKKHEKNFRRFFIGLATDKGVKRERGSFNLKFVSGEEVLRYFMECMKLEDEDALRELEAEWYDYITEELTFDGENALIWEAKTASSQGERTRAKDLYQTAFDEDMESPPAKAHFDYAQLLGSGNGKKRIEHLRKAVEKAPLTAEYRWVLGNSLDDSSDEEVKAEAEKQKAIAKELDPYIERTSLFLSFD